MSEKICFNVTEAAQSLGISRPKMYDLIHSNGFPVFKVGTRVLIPVDRLREWVEQNTAGGDR